MEDLQAWFVDQYGSQVGWVDFSVFHSRDFTGEPDDKAIIAEWAEGCAVTIAPDGTMDTGGGSAPNADPLVTWIARRNRGLATT